MKIKLNDVLIVGDVVSVDVLTLKFILPSPSIPLNVAFTFIV